MTRTYHGPPADKLTTHLLDTVGSGALAGTLAAGTNELVPVYPGSGLTIAGGRLNIDSTGIYNFLLNAQFFWAYGNQYVPSTYQHARDCWKGTVGGSGIYSMVGASATFPPGYSTGSYLLYTTTIADAAPTAAEFYDYRTAIEGFDARPFQWGTANAQPATLSFWTYASVAGQYSGAFQNTGATRSYPFTYTINLANTWEQKVINVPGDTTGTWATDSTLSIRLLFDLGSGATYQGTANTWAAANYFAAPGSQKLIDTVGRTWRLFLPQLNIGTYTTAPPFEWLPLAEQQKRNGRYVEAIQRVIVSNYTPAVSPRYYTVYWKYTKRGAPTITMGDLGNANYAAGVPTVNINGTDSTEVYKNSLGAGEGYYIFSILADAVLS